MSLGNRRLRILVLAAVAAAGGLTLAVHTGVPAVHADHIPDPDYVHAPLQYAGEFHAPVRLHGGGMAVGTDRIFVVQQYVTVLTFDLSGNPLGQFGAHYADRITLNEFNVFVSDPLLDRINVFDLSGKHLGSLGSDGTAPGQFRYPTNMALNSTHLFVADTGNDRVQTFNLSGGAGAIDGSVLIPNGTGLGHVRDPDHIALNSTHMFVAGAHDRVQIFDMAGNYAGEFGSGGVRAGQFYVISGLALNSTHLFVADALNNRVQIFDHAGNYAGEFGEYGTGPGQFDVISGLALNSTHLFVADELNVRVQIFALSGSGTAP